ncbi:MAG TPA: ABC transporter ATP-binding protein, partial [Spirochaetales bacterium]|nr:ABC transporter ATP-binding protein [Spirochaetales bacterium]
FIQYAMQIFFAFIMLSMMFIMLPRASVSAGRIADVLETEPSIVDPKNPKRSAPSAKGIVEFRGVSFRYQGSSEDVLKDISFTAEPGKTTAIIGTTGAGKTTLVSLLPRFHDVTQGAVLVDGVDVRELAQAELRSRIGFVPQKASLFSGTVKSNLLWADETADNDRLAAALDAAQAKEFVDAFPQGMEAPIAQGGANVSGGQRQRLTIARALVKKAPIYVFDDSFSALDYRTDMKLRQALSTYLKDSAVIMVTQRVATIKRANQIIVLDEGAMVGKGTHRELMESCEVYRDIALSQLKEEELA